MKIVNVLRIAGCNLGYIHMRESKLKMSELKLGNMNNMLNKVYIASTK